MITRRRFLASSVVVVAAPFAAEAQQAGKVYRVGYLSPASDVSEPFREGLRELGYVEGRNLVLEVRLAAGRFDQLPALAADLVRARVDVIAAVSPSAIQAAKEATTTIPIVMAFTGIDPVQNRFVSSLARPGGNITGVMMIADEISGKRLALLKEVLGRATRIAVLAQVNHPGSVSQVKAAREAAKNLGIELDVVEVRDSRDYETALATAAKRALGLFVVSNPIFFNDRQRLVALTAKHRLPTLCEWREMVEAGCLMAYGPNISDLYRRAATYVDRIARGATPADLPGRAAHEIRVDDQSEDCEGARSDHPAVAAAAGGPVDRITWQPSHWEDTHARPQGRVARRVDCRPQGALGEREGVHPTS